MRFFDQNGNMMVRDASGEAFVVSSHASGHINGGADQIDGDRLHISENPLNYTPASGGASNDIDDLTAHLRGVDDSIGLINDRPTCVITDTGGTFPNVSTSIVDFTGGTVVADTDNMADLANDKININTDGLYHVGGNMEVQYLATYLAAVYVYVNGAWADIYQQAGTQGSYARLSTGAIISLSAGDDISLFMYQNSGTSRTAGSRRLWASLVVPL